MFRLISFFILVVLFELLSVQPFGEIAVHSVAICSHCL